MRSRILQRVAICGFILVAVTVCRRSPEPVRNMAGGEYRVLSLSELKLPADARKVAAGTYVKTIKMGDPNRPVESAKEWMYWYTVYTPDGKDSSTTDDTIKSGSVPATFRPIIAGAVFGETRRVWSCPPSGKCQVTDYLFDSPVAAE